MLTVKYLMVIKCLISRYKQFNLLLVKIILTVLRQTDRQTDRQTNSVASRQLQLSTKINCIYKVCKYFKELERSCSLFWDKCTVNIKQRLLS